MPSWTIHDKWALRLGINWRISREINLLIDFPEKWFKQKYPSERLECSRFLILNITNQDPCLVLFKLSKFSEKFGHDMGRRRKWQRDFQLHCIYKHYGIEGIKAAILHHILDYVESVSYFDKEEIIRRIDERFGDLIYYANSDEEWHQAVAKAASEVLDFVKRNITDVINDLITKRL